MRVHRATVHDIGVAGAPHLADKRTGTSLALRRLLRTLRCPRRRCCLGSRSARGNAAPLEYKRLLAPHGLDHHARLWYNAGIRGLDEALEALELLQPAGSVQMLWKVVQAARLL